ERGPEPATREVLVRVRPRLLRVHAPLAALLVGRELERQRADAPAAQVVDGRVAGDAEEPGGELVLGVVAVERAVDLQEDVLCDIAGVLRVVRETLDETIEANAVALDEDLEEVALAREDALDDVRIPRLRAARHDGKDRATGLPR